MSNVLNGFEHPQTDNNDNAPYLEGELTPQRIAYSIAAGGANVCEVTLTVQDGHGATRAVPVPLTIWLSDAATGAGLTATAASGTVQAKSASGADFGVLTAKKALVVQTKADGTYILEITDSSKTGYYVAAQLPFSGLPVVSRVLVSGDYG
jgi:hypothetical protein